METKSPIEESVLKPTVLLMGQTPPPWHGQAVATQILFEHEWPDFVVHRLRMEFSEEMDEVGRFQWKKIRHLFGLIRRARRILRENPGCVLFYPPASAKWVPFLRDVIFLTSVRPLAGRTVFIFHASGLAAFSEEGWLRSWLAQRAYGDADVSLEVAKETVPPHEVFQAKDWEWCPCAIEVPEVKRRIDGPGAPYEALFVGSLQEGKGVLEVLRTAELLKRSGREKEFRFRVVGKWFSEAFESEARKLHAEAKLEEMVEFVGQLTGDEKWQAYHRADVFFFPTHYASEATPIVLMEALGMGLPILSTEWAGIPAMLEGCKTSHLLPIRSPKAYADALVMLEESRDQVVQIGEASQALYRERFLPESFVGRVCGALHKAQQPLLGSQSVSPSNRLQVIAYLADQNPKLGRSLGISRMSEVVLGAIGARDDVELSAVTSKSSIRAPENACSEISVPWSTRSHFMRVVTDNLHPLFAVPARNPDVWYFPKGFMPRLGGGVESAVATIHDTIIQYYQDHYPKWRLDAEYNYWASMLCNTLKRAAAVMTVSKNAKDQIESFIRRHDLPEREIYVTYEPCLYEDIAQPVSPAKADYALHLGSQEPHKRTAWLVNLWAEAAREGRKLPKLNVVGTLPVEVESIARESRAIVYLPFLEDQALVSQFTGARALILPSEVEGFGLPAVEAYYLGTPVCFTRGTSVEEILESAASKGGFDLNKPESLWSALEDVLSMPASEVEQCGLRLRETYDSSKVVARMMEVFEAVARPSESGCPGR